MSKRFTLAALAAAVALPVALASTGAQAQIASYCEGRLVANSFYSNVQSNGRTAVVSYYMQLQNRTGGEFPITYSVRFTHRDSFNRQSGSPNAQLPAYQQVTILLGKQNVNNPSGQGALNPTDTQNGVPHYTSVECGFRQRPQ